MTEHVESTKKPCPSSGTISARTPNGMKRESMTMSLEKLMIKARPPSKKLLSKT